MDRENFEIINEQIKSFISSYQENPFMVPIKRINSLHKRLILSLEDNQYEIVNEILKKMEQAVAKIIEGNEQYLYSAEAESYHTLLWKLHQYLIKEVFSKSDPASEK